MLFQPLNQLVYGFLAQILAGKETETKFIIIRKTGDNLFSNKFRPKSAGKCSQTIHRPHLTSFPTCLQIFQSKVRLELRFEQDWLISL